MSNFEFNSTDPVEEGLFKYFAKNKKQPSLADFYLQDESFFVKNSPKRFTINYWKKSIAEVSRKAGIQISHRQPDWTEILEKVRDTTKNDRFEANVEKHTTITTTSITTSKQDKGKGKQTSAPVTTSPSASASTSAPSSSSAAKRTRGSSYSSKNFSCLLTEEARKKFRDAFEAMNDDQKWLLKTDKEGKRIYVEDIMYERGENLEYEHAVHSFILNLADDGWNDYYTKEQIKTLYKAGDTTLPVLPQPYHQMFDTCKEAVSKIINDGIYKAKGSEIVDALWMTIAEMGPYNPRTNYDQDWIQRSLLDYLNLYRFGKLGEIIGHGSEMDYVIRFWSNLDKCFDDIATVGRDRTSMATFIRVNADRELSDIKPIDDQHRSVRPDMMVMKDGLEVVCGECGKEDCGGKSKKELVERNLHVPKIMKGMFCESLSKGKNAESLARTLKIAALNENNTRMRVSIMDCPYGYVTRLLHMDEREIPVDPVLITTTLFDMMKVTLKVKAVAIESIAQIKRHQQSSEKSSEPGYSFLRQDGPKKLTIPPSLYLTNVNKRQKIL